MSAPIASSDFASVSRRRWLGAAAGSFGSAWLERVAQALASQDAADAPRAAAADAVILVWLQGGPSQLETFDPHPGTHIAAGTKAIDTRAAGVRLAAGYERLAEQMHAVAVVRSLVGKEGDHERATYVAKTGYLPDPVTVHPSIGAICCHQLPADGTEIPRHVSILPASWPARGGYLGAQYDAFKMGDPRDGVPDVRPFVGEPRVARRFAALEFAERQFAQGRAGVIEPLATQAATAAAKTLMASPQLAAFDLADEPRETQQLYGETPLGRGCLAARRLVEAGVRCVEVTLGGWDSHANNHEIHRELAEQLDPALAGLLADLAARGALERTLVVCAGEFGRTPKVNALGGRDHWPHGFTALVAGGGLRAGLAIGETDPEGSKQVADPHSMADLHATLFAALGIDRQREIVSPAQRPIKLSEGTPIAELLPG
ncbi:MAG: DUF1501 domain-containing protein [Pirellulales bacterium]|nr:DUF1501 domain-containing protein [Pirellulales bacterium]